MTQSVRKRFRLRAKKLLTELHKHPKIVTWDTKGLIFINGEMIPELNIFNALQFTFYETSSKPSGKQSEPWFSILRKLGLERFIKNEKFQSNQSEVNDEGQWWFLGNLCSPDS